VALRTLPAPLLSYANRHATVSHSKQLLKYSSSAVSIIGCSDGKIFTVATPKPKRPTVYAPAATKKDAVT